MKKHSYPTFLGIALPALLLAGTAAWHSLDDTTLLALPASAVEWYTAGTFPLTVNDTTGLATATAVYQDTDTTVTAGLVPNNHLSRFLLRIEPVAGQPAQKRLVFSPRWTDRTYNILTSTNLLGDSWSALTGGSVSDNERTVTDQAATTTRKFYRIEITNP